MKKMVCWFVLCCLLLCGAAMAEGVVPESWTQALEPLQSRLDAGYIISASAQSQDGARRFFVLTKEGRNQLAIVRREKGEYELELLATHALRQGDEIPVLLVDDGESLSAFYRYDDGTEDAYVYCCDSADVWVLNSYTVATGEYSWRSFAAEEGRLVYSYYENNEKVKTRNVYGIYQREAKYLNVATLPVTLEEARSKLSQPPEIPAGGLDAKEIKFSSGKKYPVYSGPGAGYLRSGDGKASVSTNDWIQVFGTENGWALIQYDISADHMRFGYIDADALPSGARVDALAFRPVDAYLNRRAGVTDDPLNTQEPLVTLPEGAWVTWLATMGEWAYVESSTGDLLRGFVPVSSLRTHRVYQLENHRENASAALSGLLTVMPDGLVTLQVDEWKENAGRVPLYFAAYNEATMERIFTAQKDSGGTYRGSGVMTDGWGVLICPVYTEGAADMAAALSVQW